MPRFRGGENDAPILTLRDFFALVVMVMPCGLTPTEGIDFTDLYYFSMYACADVRPTHTHTNVQYRCLFEETVGRSLNLSISR